MKTLLFQSAPPKGEPEWIDTCLASVKGWAKRQGFDYQFLGDELFDVVPSMLREKFSAQKVVLSDLARLLHAERFLEEGYGRIIWADADFLIFDDESLILPDASFAFGREVWIEGKGQVLKARVKVHNAFMQFQSGNPFLGWYVHAALRLLEKAEAPVVPQFIGPKFLSSQHNLIGLPEIPAAAMFSPLTIQDVLSGKREAVDLLCHHQGAKIGGANLSRSHVGRQGEEVVLTNDDMLVAVRRLLTQGLG